MNALRIIILGMLLLPFSGTQAQFSISVNLPAPPMWGPVGYSSVRYYYLPDVEAYYDVNSSMFIYFSGDGWIRRAQLPPRYRNYDLYGGYKVVMPDYHGNTPYSHFKEHKMKYGKGYRGKPQPTIGNRTGRENRPGNGQGYHDNGNSGGHNNYKENGKGGSHGNDRGNSQGNDRKGNKGNSRGEGNGKNK